MINLHKYDILCKGKKIYTQLTEEEYFNIMEELSEQFFLTGSPKPEDLQTKIYGV